MVRTFRTRGMDINEALDRSLGEGPPPRPIEDTIRAGRSALRRRRAGSALAVCALVAVAGGTSYAIAPRGDADTAGPGPATAATSPRPSGIASRQPGEPVMPREVIRLRADGALVVVRSGAVITQRVPNPLGLEPPGYSAGAEVKYRGSTNWYLVKRQPGSGSEWTSVPARQAFPTLASWLADQVAVERGDPTLALVRFGTNGRLEPLSGVMLLEQRADPELPANFAPAGSRTVAATVRWHGAVWHELARRLPGSSSAEYFPAAASVAGKTLDQFLAYARNRYSGGEGLR